MNKLYTAAVIVENGSLSKARLVANLESEKGITTLWKPPTESSLLMTEKNYDYVGPAQDFSGSIDEQLQKAVYSLVSTVAHSKTSKNADLDIQEEKEKLYNLLKFPEKIS